MSPPLRIGDADRERAQTALGEHYVAGRLDHEEFSHRLDRIWAARTHADLLPVFADLPGPAAARAEPRGPRRRRGPGLPAPLVVALVVVATVVVAANLPLVLVAVGVWFFFLRDGCGGLRGRRPGAPTPT